MKRTATTLTLGLLLGVMLPARAGPVDPLALPVDQRENYDLFRVRCSKCHTLDKPLNVRLSPEQWRRYVLKMQRRAGSGINEQSGAKITEFLTFKESHDLRALTVPAAAPDAGP